MIQASTNSRLMKLENLIRTTKPKQARTDEVLISQIFQVNPRVVELVKQLFRHRCRYGEDEAYKALQTEQQKEVAKSIAELSETNP